AITGGVKPQVIDLARYRQQQARQQEAEFRQNELEMQRAQIEKLRHPPAGKPEDKIVDGNIVRVNPDGTTSVIYKGLKKAASGPVHYENRKDGVYAIYRDAEGNFKSEKMPGVPGKEDEYTAYQQYEIQQKEEARQGEFAAAKGDVESITALEAELN